MSGNVNLGAETAPFDPSDPRYAALQANLQGNILTSHGRHFAMHTLFTFSPDVAAAKAAVVRLRRAGFITSAAEQQAQTERKKADPTSQEVFGTILLSASGLAALGMPIPTGFGDSLNPPGPPPPAISFAQPMRAAAAELGDLPAQDWEPAYQQDIHGLLIVAYGNGADQSTQPVLDRLFAEAQAARAILETGATVLAVEGGHAHVLQGQPREHFGFVDGISQPLYRTTDVAASGPHSVFDPSAGLVSLLVADPFSSAPDAFASFFVFRKLEQNVSGWRQAVAATAARLDLQPALAGAMAVGRFQNGDPVIASGAASGPPAASPANDFDYSGDRDGLRCPYHGHIRKANPRGDTDRNFGSGDGTLTPGERNRRIARRGVTYGNRASDLSDAPTTGVGLLFMCYQANIPDQFGFMQKSWVNNTHFGRAIPGVGQDAVIGQGDRSVDQVWPQAWGGPGSVPLPDFGKFVTSRGGEFFLAVSIPTIEAL
jgi:Dyp-type peroxidase family